METVNEIVNNGGVAKFWKVDVSDEDNINRAIDDVASTFGKIDILINNAGITGVDKKTHELTVSEWD